MPGGGVIRRRASPFPAGGDPVRRADERAAHQAQRGRHWKPHAGPSGAVRLSRSADASQPEHPERRAHRPDRRRGQARPGRGRHGDPRRGDAPAAPRRTACRSTTPGERVLFPRDVVERAIADAPGSFILYDRDGEPHADIGGDRVHFVPGSSGLKVLDHRTGETRLANSTDFVEYVRLARRPRPTSPTWPRRSRPTTTSRPRCPTPGACT